MTDKEISEICKKYKINVCTIHRINNNISIDVVGNVNLSGRGLTELPLRFNRVSGNFDCSNNNLTTLKGSPKWVGDYFSCEWNNLTSLEFSPEYVGDSFYCSNNKLTNNYSETEIVGYFLSSLEQDGLTEYNYNNWRKLYKRK